MNEKLLPIRDVLPLITVADPPLKRVICALQFAPILRISEPSGQSIASFQEAVRGKYPIFRMQSMHELRFQADETGAVVHAPQVITNPTWQFGDLAKAWTVTLTQQSIALETVSEGYGGRKDLLARFAELLANLHAMFDPIASNRIGFRYMNLFDGDRLNRLSEFVRGDMLGFGRAAFADGFVGSYDHTEATVDENSLLIKSGYLKIGTQTEWMHEPIHEPAWLLDIDAWQSLDGVETEERLQAIATELTDLNCNVFRWAVTDTFLEEFKCA